jgi:hypothetical protein
MRTTHWLHDAKEDARDTARYFLDAIAERIKDGEEASNDLLNDYPDGDSYHHESHVDKEYDLQEAAALLDELADYEETDSGLWQGLEPRKAISCQAAYTYGNAVYSLFHDLIGEINDDDELPIIVLDSRLDSADDAPDERLIRARINQIIDAF